MLESNPSLGHGGSGFQGSGAGSAAAMIKELQGLTVKVVDGAAANTSITLTGIGLTDTIVSAIEFDAGVPVDVTTGATIHAADTVRFTADTTGNKVVVTYFNKP